MTAVLFSATLIAAVAPPPLLVIIGASLTALTVMPALAVALLNAVLAPFALTFIVPEATPSVRSQARKVRPEATLPLQLALGTKRTSVPASLVRSRAVVEDGDPKLDQLLPPLMEYCQLPLVLTTATTAIPVWAPASASVIWPPISDDTNCPGLLAGSSLIAGRFADPESTGALLLTTMFAPNSDVLLAASVAVAVILSPALRPLPVTSTEPLKLPLASEVREPRYTGPSP